MLFDKERVKGYYFKMIRSIVLTLGSFTAVQIVFTIITGSVQSIPVQIILLYILLNIVFNSVLALVLSKKKHLFSDLETGIVLDRINLANRITLFRLTSLPTVHYIFSTLISTETAILFPIVLGILFLTDTADGFIARKLKQITRIGQMLDSIGDYALLALISIIYFQIGFLPVWLFLIIIFRLFFQAGGMLLFILIKKPVRTRATPGGKISIAATMVLYIIELVRLSPKSGLLPLVHIIEIITGIVICILFFEKLIIFFKQGKSPPSA